MNQRPKSSLIDATVYNDVPEQTLENSTTNQPIQQEHIMPDDAVSQLNQHLNRIGQPTALSWQEFTTGSTHEPLWSCICKIGGVVRGSGLAERKYRAKNLAAAEALRYLSGLTDEPQDVSEQQGAENTEAMERPSSAQAQDGPNNATDELKVAPDENPSEISGELVG